MGCFCWAAHGCSSHDTAPVEWRKSPVRKRVRFSWHSGFFQARRSVTATALDASVDIFPGSWVLWPGCEGNGTVKILSEYVTVFAEIAIAACSVGEDPSLERNDSDFCYNNRTSLCHYKLALKLSNPKSSNYKGEILRYLLWPVERSSLAD